MGDISDMADVERFLRSEKGKAHLDEIVAMLTGRLIVEVSFSNEVHRVATVLHLDDGSEFVAFQPSLDLELLWEVYKETIDEEYFKDYPERRNREE